MLCTAFLFSIVFITHSHPAPLNASENWRRVLAILENTRRYLLETPSRRQTLPDGSYLPEEKDQATMAENELAKSMSGDLEIQQRPYIEHSLHQDFLVLGADSKEDYKKVVPNDIYYSSEKKCVNWLDNCSVNGIQNKLQYKMMGPWRRKD